MTRISRAWLQTAAVVFLACAIPAAAEECGTCHPEQRVQFEESIHRSEDLLCSSCHGGDPDARTTEAAHRGRFDPLTDRLGQPAACAGCHADLERMRAYNLPIDQYALYRTSQHGQALARGDSRVAICSDCHGAHGVVRVSDPRSPAYRRNVVDTCAHCHSDVDLASEYGLDPTIPDQYRAGVHGQALLVGGNLAAPNCTHCHGVHGATPPDVGNIEKVCGMCHDDTRRAFHSSPHHAAMEAAGLPECESCHSNHEIRSIGRSEIRQTCAECHEPDSAESRVGEEMQALIDEAEQEVAAAEAMVERARTVPLAVIGYESRLEEARTYITESLTMVHTLSPEQVGWISQRARGIAHEVQDEIEHEMDPTNRLVVLAAFWFYLLMTLAVLFFYRRRLDATEPTP
ncbi:MAG: cytochrome c3 family protein [Deltaproteobacteria bacterium]|jgi:predicted CXXCH cytochrome family protein|nr:cytochrome c3 family protein [Deltaproteobacteria bacterium]